MSSDESLEKGFIDFVVRGEGELTLLNLYERTKLKNVVLGGGSFMNSVFNGKVIENTPFENVYISHSPSDVGNSIGAALYVAHNLKNEDRNTTFSSSYLGPSFSDEEIHHILIITNSFIYSTR